jgi:hypothetical protein
VAANLAAFYTAGGALPGDADAVKQEAQKPKPWGLIGAAAAAGVIFFGIGWAIGNISVSRNDYNITTEHAGRIRDQVDKIHKQVEKVKDTLKDIKLSDKEAPNFAAIEKLGEIDFKEPDMTRDLFHTNYFSFEPTTVQQLFNYYNDTTTLAKQLQEHSQKTMKDKESIEKYVKGQAAKAEKERPLGVILDYSSKLPLAQLVEIVSPPMCPKEGETDCKPEDMKMRFRTSLGGEPQARGVKGLPQNVVFAINPTELQKQVMSGDPAMLAFRDYVRRAAAIIQTMGRITETEKQLIESLKKRATQPKLFAL